MLSRFFCQVSAKRLQSNRFQPPLRLFHGSKSAAVVRSARLFALRPGGIDLFRPPGLKPGDSRDHLGVGEFLLPRRHPSLAAGGAVLHDVKQHFQRMVPGVPRAIQRRCRVFTISSDLLPFGCAFTRSAVTGGAILLEYFRALSDVLKSVPALYRRRWCDIGWSRERRGSFRRRFATAAGSQ